MQLVLLNVSNNRLKSLPESLGSCASLEEIQANGMLSSFDFENIMFSIESLKCPLFASDVIQKPNRESG